ncbi:MAG: hypothetical protein ACRDHW_00875 [Ktedonobacteraceae bacterium]
MTFTPEISSINQRVQVGAETTIGTAVAAGKLLQCYDWTPAIQADIAAYTPTGHKYITEQEENAEWIETTIGGYLDFNGVVYLLAGAMGAITPASHGASTTAKDWIVTPPITGSVAPQTYTVMQGDSVRARKWAYGLISEFGYKGDRKSPFTVSSKMLGQPLQDGITLTASPTAVALAPAVGKMFDVYLDTASGGIGTTQLLRVLSIEFAMTNIYGPLWVLNRSTVGFTAHVDLMPKSTFKILLEADANGMTPLSYLQSGATSYLRVQAQGNQIASDGPGAISNTFTHDAAIKVGKPDPFSDNQGVYAIGYELVVCEDPAWNSGQAQTVTATNLITAL